MSYVVESNEGGLRDWQDDRNPPPPPLEPPPTRATPWTSSDPYRSPYPAMWDSGRHFSIGIGRNPRPILSVGDCRIGSEKRYVFREMRAIHSGGSGPPVPIDGGQAPGPVGPGLPAPERGAGGNPQGRPGTSRDPREQRVPERLRMVPEQGLSFRMAGPLSFIWPNNKLAISRELVLRLAL
jgi:hypothetical protein